MPKGTRNIRENVYFDIIIFSRFSSIKPCLRFLLICFAREMKRFYQNSFKNKVDFTNIMDVSPNILAKNKKFKKLRHGFVDDNNINIFLSRENPCTFLLAKEKTKRPENAFLSLTMNYRKIVLKNKLCLSKQQ